MPHVILLGDSIFDNAAYTSGGPVAVERGLPVIDLRLVCAHPSDYANTIEPSSAGGAKIARVITGLVTESAAYARATRVVAS